MTNWKTLTEPVALPLIKKFAKGDLSERAVTKAFTNTKYAGEFRSLVRQNKAHYARILARKALRRRNVEI